jgi:nicotinate-nucleotide pyrophosphorylase (carboxylating)
VEPALEASVFIKDGEKIRTGEKVIEVVGSIAGILKGERVALNFMSHLSGIASETAKYISHIKESKVAIVDTRKTIPGLRMLEKYAVRVGGGQNHRLDLGDGILIKDNHIAALRQLGMGIKDIITKARQKAPDRMKIEIETNTFADAVEAAAAGADIIMLDNLTPDEMRRIAEAIKGQAKLEASGNINLDSIRAVAMTGVDFISIGAITHSARAIDFSLELKLS